MKYPVIATSTGDPDIWNLPLQVAHNENGKNRRTRHYSRPQGARSIFVTFLPSQKYPSAAPLSWRRLSLTLGSIKYRKTKLIKLQLITTEDHEE